MNKLPHTPFRPLLAGCLALLFSAPLMAQAPASQREQAADNMRRPKICLVLSGGGARGAAHVGVIKVLEELRIPVDCIAGTSMGSLVGAAYATGMSTDDMDVILRSISTELLLKDKPPRQERSMRRKQDDRTILFSPEIGINGGKISFAKGLVSGVQLENVLRSLTKLSGYRNFDKLPIPYRAIATDLVTGKAEIFSKGDIVNAMRASMSVPGVITPAEFDGKILVDGMLTANLPVEVARQAFKPDIIIAVNVGTPLLKREDLNDILGVTGQMLSILTEQNVQTSIANLKAVDILISPDLGDYSTAAFDDLIKISPLGEEAARKVADKLKRLSLPPPQYAALRQKQQVRSTTDLAAVDEIRFDGLKRVNPANAQYVMETEVGKPLDQKVLDADMRRIYGTGDFDHVAYRIIEEDNKRILEVDAVEKPWGPNYLRFGLGLSSDFSGDAYFNLLASYRQTWLNSLGAEWRTDVQVGQNTRFFTEFYQPLTAEGSFFVAPSFDIGRRALYVYDGDNRVGQYDIASTTVNLDVGSQFHRYGEFRVGLSRGAVRPTLDTGPQAFPTERHIETGAVSARLKFDQSDSVAFPRSGWWASANLYDSSSSLGADYTYTKWDVAASTTFSVGNHTFNVFGKSGDKIGSNQIPYYDQFQWGGFLQQSGYAPGQLIGQSLDFMRVMYYHRLLNSALFEGAYGGFSLEAGRVGGITSTLGGPTDTLKSASIFVGTDSPMGPVYLGYGQSAEGFSSMYFYLGVPQ